MIKTHYQKDEDIKSIKELYACEYPQCNRAGRYWSQNEPSDPEGKPLSRPINHCKPHTKWAREFIASGNAPFVSKSGLCYTL